MDGREQVAQAALGDVGPWQMKIFFYMSLLKFPMAWALLGIIFLGAPVPFTCKDSTEQCTDKNGNECTEWTFNQTVFKETITTEWDLVCSRKHLTNLSQTTFMIGILFGTITFSVISDRWGRKKPLILTGVLQLATGLGTAFATSYWAFVILRFLQALAVGGLMTVTFVLFMEVLNGSWRTIMATLTHIPFNFGSITMSIIAYYTRHWRLFQIWVSVPVGIIFIYWWLIPESPRWLMAVGKDKEALLVLQEAAKRNNRQMPEKIPELKKEITGEKSNKEKSATFFDLFRTPNIRKCTLTLWTNWMNVGLCFFGLEQYLSHIGENVFINVAVSNACIIPGVVASIYTMDKFGRKWTLFGSQLICGLSSTAVIFLPHGDSSAETYKVVLTTIGVSGAAVGFTTLYLYSSELFPTVVRNTGLGSGSMCARIGSMVAPFIVTLDHQISPMIPPAMFGISSVLAALVCLLLPETANRELPTTLEDGENFGKKVKKEEAEMGASNRGFDNEL